MFPALGVEPATLAVPGEDTQSEDSGGAEGIEGAKEAESAKEAEGAEGTSEAKGAEGADSKSDERETTSEKPREENASS